MRFFWRLPARVMRLEQQVFSLTAQVKELRNDIEDKERSLAGIEEAMRRAASQTTVAVSKLHTELSLFRRGLGDWVPQVGGEDEAL